MSVAWGMIFRDVFVSRAHRYSLGREERSGRFYLSIPVSNMKVDYEEYYEIDQEAFERYLRDEAAALSFVARCRNREIDHLLMIAPGADRGTA
jgi:hypothetical protein